MSDSCFAFPFTPTDRGGQCAPTETGMTLRDYFAAKAMQGYVSLFGVVAGNAPTDEDIARYSYDLADAMLAARNTPEG